MTPDRAARVFCRPAGWLLPARFVAEFGDELRVAFRDRYARTRRVGGAASWLGFWWSEISGLVATAARERLRLASSHPSFDLFGNRSVLSPMEVLSTMRQDFIYSLRMIIRTPIVSAIAVLSLALALAATTAVFALLSTWLLRPLPYPDSDRLVNLFETDRNISFSRLRVSPANYFDFREQIDAFEFLGASDFRAINLTGIEEPEELTAARVMPELMTQLGAEPLMGRLFTEREAIDGENAVVLLRESLWRNRFGADPQIVGSELLLDGAPHTVIGVMPETFEYLLGTVSLWMPSDFETRREDRESGDLRILGRLRDGVTMAQAEEQLIAIAGRLAEEHPDTNRTRGVRLQSMRDEFPGETDTVLIQALMLIALAALMIACFNVAGLYLAKTDLRAKEIAVRTALGAGKGRLLRLLLTESVLLALVAGGIGLVLAGYAIRGMSGAIPAELPRMYAPHLDAPVALFALLTSAAAGVVFGISAALQALRSDRERSILLETSRGGSSTRARKRLRAALVTGEFALALAILMSAGVLTTMFGAWINGDPGFNPEGLLTAQVTLPEYRYGSDAQQREFLHHLAVELDAIPGSSGWAAMTKLPRSRGYAQLPVVVEGRAVAEDDAPRVSWSSITPSFFSTLEVRIRQGRPLLETDRADSVPVAVVNDRFVEVVLGGGDAVGERILFEGETIEIVGVMATIADFREQGIMPAVPWIYRPLEQAPARRLYLALRTAAEPHTLADPLRAAVWKIDPDQPISAIQSLREYIDMTLSGPRYIGALLYQLGFLALGLALMGIYGVVAFSVTQQTREFGIRIALGEQTGSLLRGVLRQGAKLVGLGMLIGLPLAFGLLRLLGSAMSSLNSDAALRPGPMVATLVMLTVAAAIACYLPARRATQVDPVIALQEE